MLKVSVAVTFPSGFLYHANFIWICFSQIRFVIFLRPFCMRWRALSHILCMKRNWNKMHFAREMRYGKQYQPYAHGMAKENKINDIHPFSFCVVACILFDWSGWMQHKIFQIFLILWSQCHHILSSYRERSTKCWTSQIKLP